MYHQIARNKRNTIFVVAGFLVVWLAAGLIIGWLAYGQGGAGAGTAALGLLGGRAAALPPFFGSATLPFGEGAAPPPPRRPPPHAKTLQTPAFRAGPPL